MPLPTLVCIAFASGASAAWAARAELRGARSILLSPIFGAYMMFVALVLVPITTYFYLFHGDWSLLYLVDAHRIPSAVALLGVFLESTLGAFGFVAGVALVRRGKEQFALFMASLAGFLSLLPVVLGWERLGRVGTFTQFQGDFGLVPYAKSSVLAGTLAMAAFLLAAWGYLLFRLASVDRQAGNDRSATFR